MKCFSEIFKNLSELEGKSYTELLALDGVITVDATVKTEDTDVYRLSIHPIEDSTTIRGVETLYSMERVNGKLRPRLEIENEVPLGNGNAFDVAINKLSAIYNSVKNFGVLTLESKDDIVSQRIWEDGGLAECYIDPATPSTIYFYKDGELSKILNDNSVTDISAGGAVHVTKFYDISEHGGKINNRIKTESYDSFKNLVKVEESDQTSITTTVYDLIDDTDSYTDTRVTITVRSRDPIVNQTHSYITRFNKITKSSEIIFSKRVTVFRSIFYPSNFGVQEYIKSVNFDENLNKKHECEYRNIYDDLELGEIFDGAGDFQKLPKFLNRIPMVIYDSKISIEYIEIGNLEIVYNTNILNKEFTSVKIRYKGDGVIFEIFSSLPNSGYGNFHANCFYVEADSYEDISNYNFERNYNDFLSKVIDAIPEDLKRYATNLSEEKYNLVSLVVKDKDLEYHFSSGFYTGTWRILTSIKEVDDGKIETVIEYPDGRDEHSVTLSINTSSINMNLSMKYLSDTKAHDNFNKNTKEALEKWEETLMKLAKQRVELMSGQTLAPHIIPTSRLENEQS